MCAEHDYAGRRIFESNTYFVTAYTGAAVMGQVVGNAIAHKPLGDGVLTAAATSALMSVGMGAAGALLAYDNEGRLSAWQNIANVTTTPTSTPAMEEALYDSEGQRVQQLDESNATHTTLHTYVGGTEDIASQWANASGSVTTTTTAYCGGGVALSVNGAIQTYGPYGSVRYQNGTLPTSKDYTGQWADAATSGLDYYRARYYDPAPSTSPAGQPNASQQWDGVPCACVNPVLVPPTNQTPGNIYPSESPFESPKSSNSTSVCARVNMTGQSVTNFIVQCAGSL